jgi:hypothetical protein
MKIADMCVRIDIWYGRHVVCVVSKDSSSWGIEHYDNNEISANIMLDLSVFLSMRWCEGLGTTTIIRSTMCLNYIFDLQTAQYCTAFVVILSPSNSIVADDLYPSQPQFNKVHLYCLLDCCRCRLPSTRKFCLYAMAPTSTNFHSFHCKYISIHNDTSHTGSYNLIPVIPDELTADSHSRRLLGQMLGT